MKHIEHYQHLNSLITHAVITQAGVKVMPKEVKNKGGRPTKYKDDMPAKVLELFKEGASKAEICLRLDICFDTFQDYQEIHPKFSEAVKKGMQISQGWWEMKGRQATVGEVEGFNATSFIFNMKNRFKEDWRDKQEVDNTHKFGDISDTELDEKIKQLTKGD